MNLLREVRDSILHLAFPHICEGCGMDLPNFSQQICLRCMASLSATHFHLYPDNPIEKLFWGRMPVTQATAQYYFTAGSLVRRLMHQFKYKGNKALGAF